MSDFGIDRAVRADGERRLGLAAPDRLDAHLDGGRAGGASGGDRNRRAARAEAVGDPIGEAAHQKEALEFRSAVEGSLDQGAIGDGRVGRQIGGECLATRPIELGRRRCNEQGPGKRAYRPDGGLIERFHRRHLGQREGKVGRVGARRQHEIDGAGDLRPQALRRKAANATNAGLAGRQLRPVLGLADAERGHDADPGDDDGRAFAPIDDVQASPPRSRSTKTMPSPRQWPKLVTTICDGGSAAWRSMAPSSNGG